MLASYAGDGFNSASQSSTIALTASNLLIPTITWANPAPITYGTALSATQLNAPASVPGTFVYSPAAGSVLGAEAAQTLSVTFTPADTTDYSTVNLTLRNMPKRRHNHSDDFPGSGLPIGSSRTATPCAADHPSSAVLLLHLCLTHAALTSNRKIQIPSRVFQQSRAFA